MTPRLVAIGRLRVGPRRPLLFIAGPCVVEGEAVTRRIASKLVAMSAKLKFPLVFKASYDKANRSSIHGFRGVGARKGLEILAKIRAEFDVPVVTDVHTGEEAREAAEFVDVLQIPAFLCRQTDLLLAAARTGRVVNVKKGQFMAPLDMRNVVDKVRSAGNGRILLTERGTTFGYNNLVADMRAVPLMRSLGCPVVMDATHAVQLPGGAGDRSSGQAEFAPVLACAAVAAGADGVFLETHEDPSKALSDGPNMVALRRLPDLVRKLQDIHEAVR